MSVPQLIDTILINPTVNISPSYRDTGAAPGWPWRQEAVSPRLPLCRGTRHSLLPRLPAALPSLMPHPPPLPAGLNATYSFQPLSNLVYTRDQQVAAWGGWGLWGLWGGSCGCVDGALGCGWWAALTAVHHAALPGGPGERPVEAASHPACLPAPDPHPPTPTTAPPQITTCRGIVMGRLRSPQRNLEVSLMKFCLRKLGAPGAAGRWGRQHSGGRRVQPTDQPPLPWACSGCAERPAHAHPSTHAIPTATTAASRPTRPACDWRHRRPRVPGRRRLLPCGPRPGAAGHRPALQL